MDNNELSRRLLGIAEVMDIEKSIAFANVVRLAVDRIAELEARQVKPGFVAVPEVATVAMEHAGYLAATKQGTTSRFSDIYRAMLDAAKETK
jgi:hypothetical protein